MTKPLRPYSRVYWDAPDDKKFKDVWVDDRALALWLRLLLAADMTFPRAAYIPSTVHKASLAKLIKCGLIDILTDGRYRVHGLAAERESRSRIARDSANGRWADESR